MKFSLGGHDIKVKYVKTVRDQENGAEIMGLCNPLKGEILVATRIQNVQLSEDVILHTLTHELSHYMMIMMNEGELNANEQFIDILGSYIHQFLKTAKWAK